MRVKNGLLLTDHFIGPLFSKRYLSPVKVLLLRKQQILVIIACSNNVHRLSGHAPFLFCDKICSIFFRSTTGGAMISKACPVPPNKDFD